MQIYFQEILILIIIWILRMIECISEIFNTLLGLNIVSNNEPIDALQFLLNDSKIIMIFSITFIITLFISIICTIYSIIKNMIKNNKNLSLIIGQFFISLISTQIILIVMLIIISISCILLKLILNMLDIDYSLNIAKIIFDNSVSSYLYDYSITEINLSLISPNKILGDYIITEGDIFPTAWKNNGMISPDNFNYLPCLITSILVLTSFIITSINILKRIYKIVFLYITLPISLSTLPVDNGTKYNIWKDELLKNIFNIFIIVLSINIFTVVLPILLNINNSDNISNYGLSLINLFVILSGSLFLVSSQKIFINKKEKNL